MDLFFYVENKKCKKLPRYKVQTKVLNAPTYGESAYHALDLLKPWFEKKWKIGFGSIEEQECCKGEEGSDRQIEREY